LISFLNGLAGTVTPYIGEAVGRGNRAETNRNFNMSLVLGGAMVVVMWILFFIFYRNIAYFLSENNAIDKATSKVFVIYLFLLPVDFMQMVIDGYLRGIGQEIPGFVCYGI